MEDNLVLVVYPSRPTQQDFVPLRVSQGKFQALPFFRPTQQPYHGELLHQPPSQLIIHRK